LASLSTLVVYLPLGGDRAQFPQAQNKKVGVQLPRNLTAVLTAVVQKFNFGATAHPLFFNFGPGCIAHCLPQAVDILLKLFEAQN